MKPFTFLCRCQDELWDLETSEKMLTVQLAVFVFPLWVSVSPSIPKSIRCSDLEMTALPVSWDVEGKLFSGMKLLCYSCLLKDVVISLIKTGVIVSISKRKKKIPLVPRTGGLQKAARKNWMSEWITPEYSYCKCKQDMGQGWGERKGRKPCQGPTCHWLNGKGDCDRTFVWNDTSENWRI